MKQSSNGLPTFDSFHPYILEVIKNGEETTNKVIKERLLEFLQFPEDILNQKYPNSPNAEPIIFDRVGFALSEVYKAGALKRPKRGVYQITDVGLDLLEEHGEKLTQKVLERQPAFIQYMKELELRNERKKQETSENTSEKEEKEVDIKKIIDNKNNEVAIELLDKIIDNDFYFFEELVVDLLDKMGYSGKNGQAKVTRMSNDGGIDGVINQDPLGTSTVYIQAKRYKEENVVGRPDIQSFYGALAGINADRGVFITTSSYTSGAKEFAKNQGIVLIDGVQLTDLMLEYEVGVEKAQEYIVYRLDYDYFEHDEN